MQVFECAIDNVAECEIGINGTFVGLIKECVKSSAELHSTKPDYLLVNHQFFFEHDTTPWGWCESLLLNISYEPLPKDIAADLQGKSHNTTKLEENFSYSQISCKGISSIEFVDTHFFGKLV